MKKWISLIIICFLISAVVYYLYPEATLPPNTTVQKIVVYKSKQLMEIYSKGRVVKTYSISIGQNFIGDKQSEGDKRTPEGSYVINAKNPESGYYKNLGISYPSKKDIEEAKKEILNPVAM